MNINLKFKRNFLYFILGASWGIFFLGAFYFFIHFLPFGLKFLFICTLPGIVLVIILSLMIDVFDLKHKDKSSEWEE